MLVPEPLGRQSAFLDVDPDDLDAPVLEPLPDVLLDLRSLRSAVGSPGREENQDDRLRLLIGKPEGLSIHSREGEVLHDVADLVRPRSARRPSRCSSGQDEQRARQQRNSSMHFVSFKGAGGGFSKTRGSVLILTTKVYPLVPPARTPKHDPARAVDGPRARQPRQEIA